MNRKYLNHLIEDISDIRALLVLSVLLFLRFKRTIPTLRPRQIIIPATIAQIIIFTIAAFHPTTLLTVAAIGNLIVVAIAIYPSTYPHQIKAHWVRPYYE